MTTQEIDLSEFIEVSKPVGYSCWYRTIDITVEQREKLDAALATPSITAEAISRVLAKWGFRKGGATIRNHRAGTCGCFNG